MGALMRGIDWAATPVGAPETWPQSLRTAVSILLESRFPMYIAWGPTFVQFYNDGYRPVLGSTKHPDAMGSSAQATFAESWHIIGPMFDGVRQGNAVGADDWMLPLDRHGYLEECYFTYSYSPIRDESGGVGGVLVTVSETTGRVLGERRLRTLRDLGARAGAAHREEDAWAGAAHALEANPLDVPFALLYRLDAGDERPAWIASAGWGEGSGAVASRFGGEDGPAWPFADVGERDAVVVSDLCRRFGGLPGGPWPESPDAALVLAVSRPGADRPDGFLVVGASARLALDDDYRGFFLLVADQIATAVGSARAHDEERRRADALAEIDRAKTAFFSNVSHEFRTPLTLMLGPLEDSLADREDPLSPVQRERQELVRRNGLRLQKLVNTLLDFARIEAGRAQVALVRTDLSALTVDLASSFNSALAKAGLELVVDCPPLPEAVLVDPAMWEKVVLNLLSNALKFTFEGTIRVAVQWKGETVELNVQDSGTGIEAHELPRIFDRFHRVEGAPGRSHEGTGIGLSLVRELVRLHGGEVQAESTPGVGSTFTVTLPTGARSASPGGAERTLTSTGIGPASFLAEVSQWNQVEPSPAPAGAPAGPGARILVADDNADMRGYLTRLLSPHWTVESVSDGGQALAAARSQRPDLVLSDVMMPGLDGLGLVRALRGDERTAAIPILLLSARAGEEATIEGLETGADDYLVKPFTARELVARVGAQLRVSQLRRDALGVERAHAAQTELLLAAANRATRSREEVLAVVSHDLRSPLATISTAAEVIERALGAGDLGSRVQRSLGAIRRSVDRMDRLVRDLLDLASVDSGSLALELAPRAAEEIAREVRSTFDAPARDKGVALAVDVAPGLPPVSCDKDRIAQALGNLVANAIKFTPAGGAVHIRVALDDGGIRFLVEDTGQGIDPAAQAHLFDRYWHTAQPRREGHGLGLSIAKGIVEGHGGRIQVTSAPGQGSTFSIWLALEPAKRAPLTASTEPPSIEPAADERGFAAGGGEMAATGSRGAVALSGHDHAASSSRRR
jgi:signal transduction histidine kinase